MLKTLLIDQILELKDVCNIEEELTNKTGLNASEIKGIMVFSKLKETTNNNFAEILSLSASRTSRIIDNLANKSLLSRNTKSSDRRITILTLTKKGKNLLKVITKAKKDCEKKLLARLDDLDTDNISENLVTIINTMKKG